MPNASRIAIFLIVAGSALCSIRPTSAQQIDPEDTPVDPALTEPWLEWSLGMRAVTSLNGARRERQEVTPTQPAEGPGTTAAFDFSDSLIYLRPRVPLTVSGDLRAGALFAFTFPDAYEQPGALLIGDALMFLESRYAFFRFGRGSLKSHIVPTPALRDEPTV